MQHKQKQNLPSNGYSMEPFAQRITATVINSIISAYHST